MQMTAVDYEDTLAHYGILRKSGRYPWGSGENPNQRSKSFLDITNDLRKEGMSDADIAKAFSPVGDDGKPIREYQLTSSDIRALRSRATNIQKEELIRTAQKLQDKGMSTSAIARQMGRNESSVRSLLEPGRLDKIDVLQKTADMLKREVEEKGFVDVGSNVEKDLPIWGNSVPGVAISPDKFKTALSMVKEEGYKVHDVNLKQVGTGEMTKYLVLTKPGVTRSEAFANRDKIRTISEKTHDGGHTWDDGRFVPPLSIDPKRVGVKYKEEGGADADGVIFVRPGVPDVTLGKSSYAQVRIAVGGTHYLKGMAIYKDDLPAGVDLMFNTNKSNTGNKLDAMKPLKRDKETGEVDKTNPFGAMIKDGGQIKDKNGKASSAMNIVNEEGDWDKWSNTLSRQTLSKQSPTLAKSQLALTYERRSRELERINSLTNPLIKRKLLENFGDETDAAAVHLKAVAMPRQATKVILPSNHVKPDQIYAPGYKDGERVALVRYPHAGTFEIPELTVNNKTREAQKLLGKTAPDAVLIHPRVAERLSGADFDGDHVVVIPNNRGDIKSTPALEKLKGFDPQIYKVDPGPKTEKFPDGTPTITPKRKGQAMGDITNLIADMTIKGANTDELARAVRHSMVVIDSEKHNLDYKASERDHRILELKKTYQGVSEKGNLRGASTLITRATSQAHPLKREDAKAGPGLTRTSSGTIDNKTGRKVYTLTGELDRKGNPATFRSKKLAEVDDAHTLVSEGKTRIELVYADHSNKLKSLANEARRDLVNTKLIAYSPSANKAYAHEVASLKAKLNIAERNAPLERQAQVVANRIVTQKKRANPDMEADEEKKIKGQALVEARIRTGARKERIELTDNEWDAIQAGAISNHMLEKVLNNSNLDQIRQRATPFEPKSVSSADASRARQMEARGYTTAEIAEALGVSSSTVSRTLSEGGDNG